MTPPQPSPPHGHPVDEAFTAALVADLDRHVAGLLSGDAAALSPLAHRETTARLKALVAAFSHPDSAHHHDEAVLELAGRLLGHLAAAQTPGGLFDSTNLASPPDTAFTVNDLCLTAGLAAREPALAPVADGLRRIGERALPPLLTGGVHTPNHRWELSSALARLDALLGPDPAVRARVEQWLAEGVDLQPDGMYSERSPLYAGAVTNPSLLTLADELDRPDLLDPVRRNLEAFLPLLDGDGLLESVHSRRQDQHEAGYPGDRFLLPYRRFALAEGRADFAAAARSLQALGAHGRQDLPEVMARPELAGRLPDEPAEPWTGTAVYPASGLAVSATARSRTTVFGGSDLPPVTTVRSGTANSATFLRFRHGEALLRSVRFSAEFFGLGPFRSAVLEPRPGGYVLRQTLRAGYYQPLAPADRDPAGAYAFGDEGRFHAAMAFERRPVDAVELTTEVVVDLLEDGVDLTVRTTGAATSFALELAFRPGGTLEGVEQDADGTRRLTGGELRYTVGGDQIVVGPGGGRDEPARIDPGEQYGYLGADLPAHGEVVFVTGRTPGVQHVRLRGRSVAAG
ncbi:hypothetical protein [Kineococcus rhizosphaerae]|uniref:Heparinase II/III-like protein n=1 Tax=Kineococcus rhizosphaerae TaxID=559628 RepID=A0A2T0R0R7_9ACTN|nr:hypothetical protein [Kineococcus rhizosphaerae]PRY12904.1 hypothetical protein CLV37_10989 [Kineococcus rhizosphaerae]